MLRINKLILVVLWSVLVIACGEPSSSASQAPDKIAFLGLPDGSEQWKIFIRDSNGTRDLVRLRDDATNLWRIDASHVAFETSGGPDGTLLHSMNIGADVYDIKARIPSDFRHYLLSPEGERIIRIERLGSDNGDALGYAVWILTITLDAPTMERVMTIKGPSSLRSWNCQGDAVFLLDHENGGAIMRLDLSNKTMRDVTPDDLGGYEANWVSVSCDETVMAISASRHSRDDYKLFIYRDRERVGVIDGDSVVDPFVSKDGSGVLYVDDYNKDKNIIKYYHIDSGEIFEMVGPDGAYAVPVILE